ncbi:MAG TPA: hypothetical protein VMZ06_14290 [Candidatus Bathyarchaeia archaeon]|nr:hypothetical protein [Candidatus Bathyarchaeia archaeon]
MRFGKRNRNRTVQLRREVDGPNDGLRGPVASEERSALLFEENGEKADSSVATVSPNPITPLPGADPTQRLLMALGRFHRYVAKGQAGAPQEFWSDDCMNQILTAAELAVLEGWKEIVEALTGMARVLQTYETASAAHLCVPFLNDGYEVLCLMVGDLIVNNTRSDAMATWRTRYEKAVANLTAAGLELVEDEPEVTVPTAAVAQSPENLDNTLPFPMPDEAPPAKGHMPADELSIDEFLPFSDEHKVEPKEEAEPAPREAEPPAPVMEKEAKEKPIMVPKPKDEVAPVLDALCDDLARLQKAPTESYGERFTVIGYRIESLMSYAGDNGFEAAAEVGRQMLEICRLSGTVRQLDESFLDLAYSFCGAYADAFEDPVAPAVKSWNQDRLGVLERLQEGARPKTATSTPRKEEPRRDDVPAEVEQPQPPQGQQERRVEAPEAKPARVEEGSPESLLVTAQQAIAHGDMPGAKVLALQAVAHLARAETAKAEARVKDAEAQFQQNAEQVESARQQVKMAEQEVVVAESRVAEGGSELADARTHGSLVEEKVVGIEKHVAEIEDQIRALEAAREAEMLRVDSTRKELEQARDQQKEVEETLTRLKDTEHSARARLEEARQSVKDLQRHRLELEEMLSRARETLTHHKSSMTDIEKTIAQLRPAGEPAGESGEDLLF